MHAPQITYIALTAFGLAIPRKPSNFIHFLIGTGIAISILIWGGFFSN